MATPVIFRKFKKENEVIAIFPDTYKDEAPYVMSYMHVGQHGQADPLIVHGTVLATEEEYAPLLEELQGLCGYDDLVIRKKINKGK